MLGYVLPAAIVRDLYPIQDVRNKILLIIKVVKHLQANNYVVSKVLFMDRLPKIWTVFFAKDRLDLATSRIRIYRSTMFLECR